MTPVRTANRGNVCGMARSREPIVDRRTNASPFDRWGAWPVMAGDEQQDPIS
jgi:hypothetical protein